MSWKGDFPIYGQSTFLDVSGVASMFFEPRQIPTPASGGFESTARPNSFNFFGRDGQFFNSNFFSISTDLFHGDAAFKPVDWRIKLTPTFNVNTLAVNERGIVSPNVLQGTSRTREFWVLQEAFAEGIQKGRTDGRTEGRTEGIEESVERTLRSLFLRRSGRAPTPAEQQALARRAHETTPEKLIDLTDLPGDALLAWLLGK